MMTITTQEIPSEAWRGYFDTAAKILPTVEATTEDMGRDLGEAFAPPRCRLPPE
jgi:hypothetical protein